MKKLLIILLPITTLFMSCKKDVGINSKNIVEGKIQFTINNEVSLKECLDAFKNLEVTQYDLRNFYYSKVIPGDSMKYYWNLLKARSYISVFNVQKMTGDVQTRFNALTFKNLNDTHFKEWDSIVKKELLIEMPDIGDGNRRSGFMDVAPGQERIWIEKLKKLSIIYSADYIRSYNPTW